MSSYPANFMLALPRKSQRQVRDDFKQW